MRDLFAELIICFHRAIFLKSSSKLTSKSQGGPSSNNARQGRIWLNLDTFGAKTHFRSQRGSQWSVAVHIPPGWSVDVCYELPKHEVHPPLATRVTVHRKSGVGAPDDTVRANRRTPTNTHDTSLRWAAKNIFFKQTDFQAEFLI